MKHSIENIDQLILEKEYNQLTQDELLAVNEFITNEIEYNDFKHMLRAVKLQYQSEIDIDPGIQIKEKLVANFEKHISEKSKISNIFSTKNIQILIAAASIALLIGFIFSTSKGTDTATLAKITPQNKITIEKDSSTNTTLKIPETQNNTTQNTDFKNYKMSESKTINTTIEEPLIAKTQINDATNKTTSIVLKEEMFSHYETESSAPSSIQSAPINNAFSSNNKSSLQGVSANAYLDAEYKTLDEVSSIATLERKETKPINKKSKSLAENQDLIPYFYTAM